MNKEKEIWKDVPGYEGLYQVSNLGSVKSLERMVKHKLYSKGFKKVKGKLKTLSIGSVGYKETRLAKNNIDKTFRIHQLVAMAFLSHSPRGHDIVVNHINHNKLDNRLLNLELMTNRENTSHKKEKGTSKYPGVSWDKSRKKWHVSAKIDNKTVFIGRYISEEDASKAYVSKLKKINSSNKQN